LISKKNQDLPWKHRCVNEVREN